MANQDVVCQINYDTNAKINVVKKTKKREFILVSTQSLSIIYIHLFMYIFSNFHLNGGLIYQCILYTIEAKKDCSHLGSICLWQAYVAIHRNTTCYKNKKRFMLRISKLFPRHIIIFSPFHCNRKMIELIKFQLYASETNNNDLARRQMLS